MSAPLPRGDAFPNLPPPAPHRRPAAAPDAVDGFLAGLRSALAGGRFERLVLSKPRRGGPGEGADVAVKITARRLQLKEGTVLSLVESHPTRDLTRNLPFDAAVAAVADGLASRFDQAHLVADGEELRLLTSKKGRQTLLRRRLPLTGGRPPETTGGGPRTAPGGPPAPVPAAHDRLKRRPIAVDRPYLQRLGLTDVEGRLVPSMARKWKQINRFVEVLHSALEQTGLLAAGGERPIEVLDFGSGKGYLTFALHDHLHHGLGLQARVTGVDLKDDMIALCNRVAGEVGADGLVFERGDVASRAPRRADVMIALHACDTATDHAIAAGVAAGASVIVCAPCCHKELRPQLLAPHPLRPILKHGVHLGQQAEMLTDGLRAMLLEACGYATQVFEFVSLEHTGKNKMILALRRAAVPAADRAAEGCRQVEEIKRFYGIREQCLERLLKDRLAPPAT